MTKKEMNKFNRNAKLKFDKQEKIKIDKQEKINKMSFESTNKEILKAEQDFKNTLKKHIEIVALKTDQMITARG